MPASAIGQAGDSWVLGTAGAAVFPADEQGGSTLTAADSVIYGAKSVYIAAIRLITIHVANAIEVVDYLGAVIPGLTITPSAANRPGETIELGVQFDNDASAAVGLKCNGTNVAALRFRKLE